MIKGIQHFSFTVTSLEESINFFCSVLGLKVSPLREAKGERADKILGFKDVQVKAAHIILGNGHIELMEYVNPKGQKIDLSTCNPGVGHISFIVDDIQTMYEDLSAKGVKFNSPPLWSGGGVYKGYGICYLKGPDEITIELMQPPNGLKMDPITGFVME